MTDLQKRSALDRWISAGLRECELPSGTRVKLMVPQVEDMLRRGYFPTQELRSVALKFGSSGVNTETLDTAALGELLDFMQTLVAYAVKSIWNEETNEWEAVTLTPAMLSEATIDGDDYAALQGIVTRRFTPNQITALSRRDRGLLSADEAEHAVEQERSDTVPGWTSFRDEQRSGDAGTDGGTVRGASVGDAADQRPVRRARAGRRGKPAARSS